MKDIHSHLRDLRRPQLLVRAALHGMNSYNRDAHLARYIAVTPLPGPAVVLMQLLDIERDHNDARIAKTGTYIAAHHIDVLVVIMSEAQLLQTTSQPRLVFS